MRPDSPGVVLVGLLWRSGSGACANMLQRRPGPGSAAIRTAEYQRFFSGAPARSGPLQQIWTNRAAMDPQDGRHGSRRRPLDAPPDAETCTSHSNMQFQPSFSSAKCTSRRGRGQSRSSWTAAQIPLRNISGDPVGKAQ